MANEGQDAPAAPELPVEPEIAIGYLARIPIIGQNNPNQNNPDQNNPNQEHHDQNNPHRSNPTQNNPNQNNPLLQNNLNNPNAEYISNPQNYDLNTQYNPNAQFGLSQYIVQNVQHNPQYNPNAQNNQNAPYNQNAQYDPNAQYNQNAPYNQNAQYDPNAQYIQNAPYNQNAQYDPNAQYNQNAPYNQNVQYDANAQYNQNAPYNQNAQYDPNAQYNPQYEPNAQYSQDGQYLNAPNRQHNIKNTQKPPHNQNAQYNQNAQPGTGYDPNAQFNQDGQYNPNAQFNQDGQYNPNAQNKPNAQYDPNFDYRPGQPQYDPESSPPRQGSPSDPNAPVNSQDAEGPGSPSDPNAPVNSQYAEGLGSPSDPLQEPPQLTESNAPTGQFLRWLTGSRIAGFGTPSDSGMNYETAFELTGRGKFNWLVMLCCSLIFIHSLLETVALGYIITPSECYLRLTVGQKSMLNSSTFIGILFTAICWGIISDYYGRKMIMLPCLLAAVGCSFISSLCPNFISMFIFRVITGCFIACTGSTVLVYLGEMNIAEFRDQALSIAVTIGQITFVLVPAVGWLIIPRPWTMIKPWRLFMWTWGLIGGAGAALLFFLPESPRYLLAAKGQEETLPVLAKMYAWNKGTSPENYPVKAIKACDHTHSYRELGLKGIWADLKELLKPPLLLCYILTHFGMFMVFFTSNGLYIWMPDFVNAMLHNKWEFMSICGLIKAAYSQPAEQHSADEAYIDYVEHIVLHPNDTHDIHAHDFSLVSLDAKEEIDKICTQSLNTILYPSAMVMELVYLAPFLFVNFMIDRMEKKKLFMYIMVFCAVGLVCAAFFPVLVISVILMVLGLCSGGGTSILSALAIDAFPTSLRALAMCTMYTIGQFGATAGSLVISYMGSYWCYLLFPLFAGLHALSGIVMHLLWPDTDEVRTRMELRQFSY